MLFCRAVIVLFVFLMLCEQTQGTTKLNAEGFATGDTTILHLTEPHTTYYAGTSAEWFVDSTRALTIQEVSSPRFNNAFRPSSVQYPQFGITSSAVWFRLRLRKWYDDQYNNQAAWTLAAAGTFADSVEVYCLSNHDGQMRGQKEWHKQVSGVAVAAGNRPLHSLAASFPLRLEHDSTETIYLRFSSTTSILAELILYPSDTFIKKEICNTLTVGTIYGVFIFTILYNCVLWLTLRDRIYGLYVGYALVNAFTFTLNVGYLALYGTTSTIPNIFISLPPVAQILSAVSGALFCRQFFGLRETYPVWNHILMFYV